jgi:hypothetical protein
MSRIFRSKRAKQQDHQDPARRSWALTAGLPGFLKPREPKQSKPQSQQSIEPRKCNHMQSESLFFKLPPEIRLLIYQRLFGSRTVHVELLSHPCTCHPSACHPSACRPSASQKVLWRRRVCCRVPESDYWFDMCCIGQPRCYPQLDTSILFTCRQT